MWEWALDWHSSSWYSGAGNACDNCANLTNDSDRVGRGGYFANDAASSLAANRGDNYPAYHDNGVGFRCARTP